MRLYFHRMRLVVNVPIARTHPPNDKCLHFAHMWFWIYVHAELPIHLFYAHFNISIQMKIIECEMFAR